MCHNTITLKCQMAHLGVIKEHAKFELFSWHYKVGTAISAAGVLWQCESFNLAYLPGLLVTHTANH